MEDNIRLFLTGFSAFILAGSSGAQSPDNSDPKPHWLFVDEIIVDQPPDYRSDLFFADRASIKQQDGHFTVSISHIVLTEAAGTQSLKNQVTDTRAQLVIDCRERVFKVANATQYDGEEQLIDPVSPAAEKYRSKPMQFNAGSVKIVSMVCDGDDEFAEQKFPSQMQPLTALLAYLNADWSK